MNEPTYNLGDRVSDTHLTICGYLRMSNGEYRYYLQIGNSDNTMVVNERDIECLSAAFGTESSDKVSFSVIRFLQGQLFGKNRITENVTAENVTAQNAPN